MSILQLGRLMPCSTIRMLPVAAVAACFHRSRLQVSSKVRVRTSHPCHPSPTLAAQTLLRYEVLHPHARHHRPANPARTIHQHQHPTLSGTLVDYVSTKHQKGALRHSAPTNRPQSPDLIVKIRSEKKSPMLDLPRVRSWKKKLPTLAKI